MERFFVRFSSLDYWCHDRYSGRNAGDVGSVGVGGMRGGEGGVFEDEVLTRWMDGWMDG